MNQFLQHGANIVNKVSNNSFGLLGQFQIKIDKQIEKLGELIKIQELQIPILRPLIERSNDVIVADLLETTNNAADLTIQATRQHLNMIKQAAQLIESVQEQIKNVDQIEKDMLPVNTTIDMVQTVKKYDQIVNSLDQMTQKLTSQINSTQTVVLGLANVVKATNNLPLLTNNTHSHAEYSNTQDKTMKIQPSSNYSNIQKQIGNFKEQIQGQISQKVIANKNYWQKQTPKDIFNRQQHSIIIQNENKVSSALHKLGLNIF